MSKGEMMARLTKLQKENEEMAECTFSPRINKKRVGSKQMVNATSRGGQTQRTVNLPEKSMPLGYDKVVERMRKHQDKVEQ